MKLAIPSLTVLLSAAAIYGQDALTINTPPSVVQCQPQLISWTGGTGPFFITVSPAGNTASTLVNLGEISGDSVTWDVNLAAGTNITLSAKDQTGFTSSSAPVTISNSSDSSCVGQSVSISSASATSSASSSGGSTSSAASSASTTGLSSATSTSTSGSSTGTSSGSSGLSSTSTSTSASSTQSAISAAVPFAELGVSGIAAALMVALLA